MHNYVINLDCRPEHMAFIQGLRNITVNIIKIYLTIAHPIGKVWSKTTKKYELFSFGGS